MKPNMDTLVTPSFVPAIPALAQMGVGRSSAYRLLNEGTIPAVKLLGRTMVRPDDLAAFARDLPAYPVKRGRPRKVKAVGAALDVE